MPEVDTANNPLTLSERIKSLIGPTLPLEFYSLPRTTPLRKRGTGKVIELESLSNPKVRIKVARYA